MSKKSTHKKQKDFAKLSPRAQKRRVFKVTETSPAKTRSGLTVNELVKNTAGKVVSRKRSNLGRARAKANGLGLWRQACKEIHEEENEKLAKEDRKTMAQFIKDMKNRKGAYAKVKERWAMKKAKASAE